MERGGIGGGREVDTGRVVNCPFGNAEVEGEGLDCCDGIVKVVTEGVDGFELDGYFVGAVLKGCCEL